ncbi:GH3 auxin-responsive promoter family protein [Treponema zioleckii]|uniref:GH3 auxin-responsive promoter family protein n=1 Tax=Treponema zioleckii TaxID=331680 RepID=UPI00168B67E2|nr:GH3 auxin-responsive promoter family protein [Treponema zioleckii]
MKKEKNARLISFALGWVGRKQLKILKKASKNCRLEESKTLRGILAYAKDTEWGKAHHFDEILSAKTDEELFSRWQKFVPPQDYENLRPFIDQHKNGKENILFPGKPMMYATTSGTTNAPKWIPITQEYYSKVYSKMTKLWLYTFMMHRPKVFWQKCVSIVGKVVEGYAPDGTICGSVSGVTQRDCPEFLKTLYSAPADIFHITDYRARNYALMRTGLEQHVSSFITANPSTVIELQRTVDENLDEMIKDIENGTLSERFEIAPEIRSVLSKLYKPNKARADELRALREKYGRILPKHYWPDFQFLTTWRCGNTHVYTNKFEGYFPEQTLHQEFGYFASECRAGLVMNGGCDTVPFPHAHYFEFVSADDMDKPEPRFYQLHELEVGKRYLIYITTYAGLYRYNMNDMIEVTGMYGTIPTIQFIQKVNGIVSMTGEKVHERQFMEAVQRAEDETGLQTRFYVGFADVEKSLYHFYFDFMDESVTQEKADSFSKKVDENLKKINVEYAAKRDSFRLKAPETHIMKKNAFEDYKVESIEKGLARDGQFKLNLLMQDEKRHAIFKHLVK